MESDIEKILDIGYRNVNITFSCFGIRNLLKRFNNPIVKIKLTNAEEKYKLTNKKDAEEKNKLTDKEEEKNVRTFRIEEGDDINNDRSSLNPTFAQIQYFKGLDLYKEPLLWPMIELNIQEESKGIDIGLGGAEELNTTIALIPYAQGILEQKDINYAIHQFGKN